MNSLEISLLAIVGTRFANFQVWGHIHWKPATILVDLGCSHNFVDPTTSKRVGVKPVGEEQFEMVANGNWLVSECRCSSLSMCIQDLTITTDFYILPLNGCDVVLGARRLQILGPCNLLSKESNMCLKAWPTHPCSWWLDQILGRICARSINACHYNYVIWWLHQW